MRNELRTYSCIFMTDVSNLVRKVMEETERKGPVSNIFIAGGDVKTGEKTSPSQPVT